MFRIYASNSHSYTHLLLALGIVREPTVCQDILPGCMPGYFEVINPHSVGSLTIPRALIGRDWPACYVCLLTFHLQTPVTVRQPGRKFAGYLGFLPVVQQQPISARGRRNVVHPFKRGRTMKHNTTV